jgi:hypothetical protein
VSERGFRPATGWKGRGWKEGIWLGLTLQRRGKPHRQDPQRGPPVRRRLRRFLQDCRTEPGRGANCLRTGSAWLIPSLVGTVECGLRRQAERSPTWSSDGKFAAYSVESADQDGQSLIELHDECRPHGAVTLTQVMSACTLPILAFNYSPERRILLQPGDTAPTHREDI